ncbi:MAG TPA: hypothetical protein PK674_00955 [Candidatus Absconditabacterales bacterium]|nr:hypothetical protein [Candidatus Absconditabacterales bacterium]HOQ78871.1 hypothetical protein [Candidatus Absconditabacterales bacterium]HPK28091.1 hypothetical protein [Candidatus Absconditabacterales bacterium]
MKKITLFILIGFSVVLLGCKNQGIVNEDWNLIDNNEEELVSDELEILEDYENIEENNDSTEIIEEKVEEVVEEQVEKQVEDVKVSNTQASKTNTVKEDNLAKCLTSKGIKLYGMAGCPYCKAQIELFGDDFQYINYINCSEDPNVCVEKGISGVPAWEFIDGSIKSGLHSLEDLADLVGCNL